MPVRTLIPGVVWALCDRQNKGTILEWTLQRLHIISLSATIKDTLMVFIKVMFRPKHLKSNVSVWFTSRAVSEMKRAVDSETH